jgi:MFS family permease
MSTTTIRTVGQANATPTYLARPALAVIGALFCGYLAVGLPLPVIPLFVQKLGFSNLTVGCVIGVQFLATVLTRGYAGRVTDQQGGKRAALQGAGLSALGGVLYMIAALPGISSGLSLGVVVAGRLAAGLGESQFVTGCVSWSIASVGPQRAGMSMSWTGIAMFAALAIGAPVGMTLYHQWGLQAAMIACVIAPMLAIAIAVGATSYVSPRVIGCRFIAWSVRSGGKGSP